jgi:hypothetical protein
MIVVKLFFLNCDIIVASWSLSFLDCSVGRAVGLVGPNHELWKNFWTIRHPKYSGCGKVKHFCGKHTFMVGWVFKFKDSVKSDSCYIISLHGVITLFCRNYGVQYRLLSTCVGSFACPGIDTRVQGTTVWSPLQATVHLCGIFYLPWHRHSSTMDHGMESTTGYCPSVWDLLLALA